MSLSFAGSKISTVVQQKVVELDLGSVLKVKKSFATGTPATLTQKLSIEGINHTITPTAHTIQFRTAVRDIVFYWTLDDPVLGQLTTDNAVS